MKTQRQIIRFVMVGGLNTIFAYALYAFAIFLGMSYPLATLLSTVFGVMFNFKTTGKFVFNNTDNSIFFRFAGMYAMIYLFNMVFIRWIQIFTDNLYLAGFIAIFPAAALSFILSKFIVFRDGYEVSHN